MSNVHEIPNEKRLEMLSRIEKQSLKSGGEPPYDGGMEARVAKLEDFALEARDRLTRVEMKLDATATKADLADLRAEVHKAIGEQTWKLIGAILTFGTLLSAAVFFIARNVK